MAIKFLFPTATEAAPFREACPDADVVVCGVGMAAVAATMAQLMVESSSIEMVILAGIAGSYDLSKHGIDDVVEVSCEQIEELPLRFRTRYNIEPRFALPSATSNTVNRSNYIGAESQIENMEGASVVAICKQMKIPCSEIRAISNFVGDDFEKWSVQTAIDALTEKLTIIYNG